MIAVDSFAGTNRPDAKDQRSPLSHAPDAAQQVVRSASPGRLFSLTLLLLDLVGPAVVVLMMPHGLASTVVLAPLAIVVWARRGLYRRRFALSVLDDVPDLLLGLVIGAGVCELLTMLMPGHTAMTWTAALVMFVSTVLVRAVAYRVELRARRRGRRPANRAVIIGSGSMARRLAERTREYPEVGVFVVGFLSDDQEAPALTGERRLGTPEDLDEVVRLFGTTDVFLASGESSEDRLTEILRGCQLAGVDVYKVPRFANLRWHMGPRTDQIWGIPLTRMSRVPLDGPAWHVKRLFDVVTAVIALVLLAPLMLALAVAVRRETGPKVLFTQERIGRNGRPFTLLKFRSFAPDASSNPETTWSISNHARLGPVGRFIRRTSLDELPQLLNVLKGDMSIVGPRPERPHFVSKYGAEVPHYIHRHRVPVGLTGYAAINGLRGDTSIADRALFDNFYIENWSLWLDVKIVLRTVSKVIGASGG